MNIVQNYFPEFSLPYRIALIGEVPSAADVQLGMPFSSYSGDLLSTMLTRADIVKKACFLGNVVRHYNPNQAFFPKWDSYEVQSGLDQLKMDLKEYNPNLVVLLGQLPLKAAGEFMLSPNEARGSLFISRDDQSPMDGFKCLATLNPAKCIQQWDWVPLLGFDLKRAREEGTSPTLEFLPRELETRPSYERVIELLEQIERDKLYITIDLEGYAHSGITMFGIALSKQHAFVIYFPHYDDEQQLKIFRALRRVLMNPDVPKNLQNGSYDNFCTMWKWKTPILGQVDDTMLSGWEMYCELPKGLATQVSIYCKAQSYKWMRSDEHKGKKINLGLEAKLEYNLRDCVYTHEIAEEHRKFLTGRRLEHYRFNVGMLPILNYMTFHGIRYDREEAKRRHDTLAAKQRELADIMRLQCGVPLNPNSPPQMVDVLYKRIGLPPQYQLVQGRKTNKLTCDTKALLTLARSTSHPILSNVLKWRAYEGVRKQLATSVDDDGRMRCSYNVVGTETGRLNCSTAPHGNGTNLQTITKKNRDLYMADPGNWFFQCDLEGADGWTVAAECAALNDRTMLDDYQAGIKPAKIIALLYLEDTGQLRTSARVNKLSRDEIKELLRETPLEPWLYFTSKRAQHATNYGVKKRTMSSQIMLDSYKMMGIPILVSERDCERFQQLYRSRYPGVSLWQHKVEQDLHAKGYIESASGHVRHFFGRRKDHKTLMAALAHGPQANTTFATNSAMQTLWNDPENRDPQTRFVIEPLHQVHDALCGQFPKERTDWAIQKLISYGQHPLEVSGVTFTIPFGGGYGPHWGAVEPEHPENQGTF